MGISGCFSYRSKTSVRLLYDDIVHMYVGKSTLPYYSNQMTEEEFIRGMDFVRDHFLFTQKMTVLRLNI